MALAEFYNESSNKFSLSLIADRFLCGGSALTTGRGVSSKRLALVEAIPGYPDVEALLLQHGAAVSDADRELVKRISQENDQSYRLIQRNMPELIGK